MNQVEISIRTDNPNRGSKVNSIEEVKKNFPRLVVNNQEKESGRIC